MGAPAACSCSQSRASPAAATPQQHTAAQPPVASAARRRCARVAAASSTAADTRASSGRERLVASWQRGKNRGQLPYTPIPSHGATRYSRGYAAKRTALAPGAGALAQPCEQLPVREPLALSCNMPTHVQAAGPAQCPKWTAQRRARLAGTPSSPDCPAGCCEHCSGTHGSPSRLLVFAEPSQPRSRHAPTTYRSTAPSGVRGSQALREGCCGLVYRGGHARELWSRAARGIVAARQKSRATSVHADTLAWCYEVLQGVCGPSAPLLLLALPAPGAALAGTRANTG